MRLYEITGANGIVTSVTLIKNNRIRSDRPNVSAFLLTSLQTYYLLAGDLQIL